MWVTCPERRQDLAGWNVLHVAVNRGNIPAVFVGGRNEPSARESLVMFPDMDAKVP
jgi:uncharacterized RmlC-like cupin family protein